MANRPIKEFALGKCKAAVFQGDYKGQKTYSVKFQKSYQSNGQWTNTDFFNLTDLRDLHGLIGCMLDKQVKERVPGQNNPKKPDMVEPEQVKDELENFEPPGEEPIPF